LQYKHTAHTDLIDTLLNISKAIRQRYENTNKSVPCQRYTMYSSVFNFNIKYPDPKHY